MHAAKPFTLPFVSRCLPAMTALYCIALHGIPGVIDAEYPEICANTQSSVSALHVYQGTHLPERYQNRLFVGDYSKVCNVCYCVVLVIFFVAVRVGEEGALFLSAFLLDCLPA